MIGRVARGALLWIGVGALVSGSTCDNQDLSGRFVVSLATSDTESVHAYRQPYIGRLTVDFGLRNNGDVPTAYDIRVQAQTTGDSAATACENATNTSARVLETGSGDAAGTVDANSGLPSLSTFDRAHFLEFPADAEWGYVALSIRSTSGYRFYSSSAELNLVRDDGQLLTPDVTDTVDCDLFGHVREFTLTDGTYYLGTPEDGSTVLVEEDCEQVRTVPRSCPGASSPPFTRRSITLEPDGFVSGRINSEDLGIGDQAVVSLACADGASCDGELELFFLVQQLECRAAGDCTGTQSCTEDGYCRQVGEGGCASAVDGRLNAVVPLLLLGALIAFSRRRG